MEALLFNAAGGHYLAPLTDLDEVLMPARLRPMARAPGFLVGVLDLRGGSLPVLDLAERLGQPMRPAHDPDRWRPGNRILRFRIADLDLGAIVETVTGIRTLVQAQRRESVVAGTGDTGFLGDLWPLDGRLTQAVRLSRLLAPAELALLLHGGTGAGA